MFLLALCRTNGNDKASKSGMIQEGLYTETDVNGSSPAGNGALKTAGGTQRLSGNGPAVVGTDWLSEDEIVSLIEKRKKREEKKRRKDATSRAYATARVNGKKASSFARNLLVAPTTDVSRET